MVMTNCAYEPWLVSLSQNELLFAEIEYMQKRVRNHILTHYWFLSYFSLFFNVQNCYYALLFITLFLLKISAIWLCFFYHVNNIGSRRSTYITIINSFELRSLSQPLSLSHRHIEIVCVRVFVCCKELNLRWLMYELHCMHV